MSRLSFCFNFSTFQIWIINFCNYGTTGWCIFLYLIVIGFEYSAHNKRIQDDLRSTTIEELLSDCESNQQ